MPRYLDELKPVPAALAAVPKYGGDDEFPQIYRGEPNRMNWRRSDFRMKCCDCGLVHRMRFNVRDEWLIIRAVREARSKAQRRREEKGEE